MRVQERYKPEKKITPAVILLRVAIVTLLVSACIRLFFFETVTVKGSEMLPGVGRGDTILVNRFATGLRLPFFNNVKIFGLFTPESGDLVVIKHPWHAWSGLAEFFDTISASVFGLTGDGELRLVRVMARGGQRIRIDASGLVHVQSKQLTRKRVGALLLHNRAIKDGKVLRRQIVQREIISQDSFTGQALPDLSFSTWQEGAWQVAGSDPSQEVPQTHVFPLPVTNDAIAATWGQRWIAGTLLQSDETSVAILRQGQTSPTPALFRDDLGNLSYQVSESLKGQLITVESGVAWLIVPEGMIFVLNDLRDAFNDSRIWGPIRENTIIGIPMLRVWPLGRFDSLD